MAVSEAQDQESVIEWARYQRRNMPCLDLLEGSMNGVKLNIGQAVKAKKQGMIAGMPDLQLHVARGVYHALYIELKYGKNKCSPVQLYVHARLRGEGNKVEVCWGAEQAILAIKAYIEDRE